jgi:hypothetical protein
MKVEPQNTCSDMKNKNKCKKLEPLTYTAAVTVTVTGRFQLGSYLLWQLAYVLSGFVPANCKNAYKMRRK